MRIGPNGRVLIGLVLGMVGGALAGGAGKGSPQLDWVIVNLAEPAGQIFLRLLLMVTIPLVFASVAVGIASLGSTRSAGRVGIGALLWFVGLAAAGAVVGLAVATIFRPGALMSAEMQATIARSLGAAPAAPVAAIGVETIVNVVPANVVEAAAKGELLGVLFFSLLFGAALGRIPPETAAPVLRFLEGVAAAAGVIVSFAMTLAPIGVFALSFAGFARFGFELLRPLGSYVLAVVVGLGVVLFALYPVLVRLVSRLSPAAFLAQGKPALITALATASSNATLPTTLRVAREALGLSPGVAGLVVPLGASLSRAGTSVFTATTALFLAQAMGLEVTMVQVGLVALLATVTAIAAGGVPSGVIPLLATVVAAAGVPAAAIGLILGVEPILGMLRTPVNVAGALVATAGVEARSVVPLVTPGRSV